MLIIDDLLLWLPMKGLVGISRRLQEMVEKERQIDGELSNLLLENQLSFELGEIDKSEFNKREKRIINEINNRRQNERENNQ